MAPSAALVSSGGLAGGHLHAGVLVVVVDHHHTVGLVVEETLHHPVAELGGLVKGEVFAQAFMLLIDTDAALFGIFVDLLAKQDDLDIVGAELLGIFVVSLLEQLDDAGVIHAAEAVAG